MQALALVRNAPERDRETEMHIAAASIATRPVILATHKGPIAARKTYVVPPPPLPPPTTVHNLSSMHFKNSNNDRTDIRLDNAIWDADGQPPSQKESFQLDTRDDNYQDHRQHAGLRLLKGKHMAGTTSNKAGPGRRHSRKHFEAIHPTAVDVCTEEDEQEAVMVSTTPTSIAAATIVICTSDKKESSSFTSHKQSLITTNQEVTAATSYQQVFVHGEGPLIAPFDDNAYENDVQQIEQYFEADPTLPQESDHTSMDVAWQNAEAEAAPSEEGKSESLTSIPAGDMDVKQQHLAAMEPASLPSPHAGCNTRPTTTTSSLLAALSVAFSGETWQLPSTTSSSSESTIGTAPTSSHPLPHHQNPSPFSFDGIDTRANIHHHKSHRPTPLSTKRPPRPSIVRTWLPSKQNKTDKMGHQVKTTSFLMTKK